MTSTRNVPEVLAHQGASAFGSTTKRFVKKSGPEMPGAQVVDEDAGESAGGAKPIHSYSVSPIT